MPIKYESNVTPPGEPNDPPRALAPGWDWGRSYGSAKCFGRRARFRGKPAVPSRNAATAASLAPLSTAPGGAARRRHFQTQLQRAEAFEVGRLEVQVHRPAPVQLRRHPSRRSGQVKAYWIGSFMSGGLSWAITEPSLYSTIECTIDCGWITTAIWSAVRSNSHRASMISRALFIKVAESTVIFGPIAQVGWARASATVTWASCSAE